MNPTAIICFLERNYDINLKLIEFFEVEWNDPKHFSKVSQPQEIQPTLHSLEQGSIP